MAIYYCYRCGGRIIFRRGLRLPDGTYEVRMRPFPIHLDGPCQFRCVSTP